MKQKSIIQQVCDETDTKPADWNEMDGPDSGVGVDYWFVNKHTGQEVYVNDDQGHVTINVGGDGVDLDYDDEE